LDLLPTPPAETQGAPNTPPKTQTPPTKTTAPQTQQIPTSDKLPSQSCIASFTKDLYCNFNTLAATPDYQQQNCGFSKPSIDFQFSCGSYVVICKNDNGLFKLTYSTGEQRIEGDLLSNCENPTQIYSVRRS
jgi:hypothetical protein